MIYFFIKFNFAIGQAMNFIKADIEVINYAKITLFCYQANLFKYLNEFYFINFELFKLELQFRILHSIFKFIT